MTTGRIIGRFCVRLRKNRLSSDWILSLTSPQSVTSSAEELSSVEVTKSRASSNKCSLSSPVRNPRVMISGGVSNPTRSGIDDDDWNHDPAGR